MNLFSSKSSKNTLVYIIIALVILVIFLMIGGTDWYRGAHFNHSIGVSHWNWTQILISFFIGLAFGWYIHKKRS